MTRRNTWTRIQPVQFEWEKEPQTRAVRLSVVSGSLAKDEPSDEGGDGDKGRCQGQSEPVPGMRYRLRRGDVEQAHNQRQPSYPGGREQVEEKRASGR